MSDQDMSLPFCTCARCGHKWYLRKPELPRVCPRCKSPYWNALSEYKQELELDAAKASDVKEKLTVTMNQLGKNPNDWNEVIKKGWTRMLESSEFPIRNIERVLNSGFSVYNWFLQIPQVSEELVADVLNKLCLLEGEQSKTPSELVQKAKEALEWKDAIPKLDIEGIKILAFLWFADACATNLRYPESEATIQEKAWSLLEENLGRKKEELLKLVEDMVDRIEESSVGATSWTEVIRFP